MRLGLVKKVKSMQFFQTGFEMFKGRKHNELDKKNLFRARDRCRSEPQHGGDAGVNLSMETDVGVNLTLETDVGVNLSMEIDIGVNLSMETDAGVNLCMEEVVEDS